MKRVLLVLCVIVLVTAPAIYDKYYTVQRALFEQYEACESTMCQWIVDNYFAGRLASARDFAALDGLMDEIREYPFREIDKIAKPKIAIVDNVEDLVEWFKSTDHKEKQ